MQQRAVRACSLFFEPFDVLLIQLLPLIRVRHLALAGTQDRQHMRVSDATEISAEGGWRFSDSPSLQFCNLRETCVLPMLTVRIPTTRDS